MYICMHIYSKNKQSDRHAEQQHTSRTRDKVAMMSNQK